MLYKILQLYSRLAYGMLAYMNVNVNGCFGRLASLLLMRSCQRCSVIACSVRNPETVHSYASLELGLVTPTPFPLL